MNKQVNLKEIQERIRCNKPILKKKFKVKDIGIFGSYVRGEQKENSDLDVLVEFGERVGFFKFLELEEYLEGLLKLKVDLVSRKALKPRIGQHILKEVVMI
ncbi:MAG: nucleotidyltransferase [Candidatus Aminicenantes bacterium]|nr:nucleotidyltransferase [Candidatus Aminicenantes bacterium]NIM82809.1 nucleotidyltransferase [Candidatus Aminicenantes bacterium]NIN22193.1 nucleotidyltransferase [Candidatus Aminicenantes bacterium]NIN45953.1 nucleotidyltransferase [Candidatus Aminicenantes bacterium]NIN88789.1 nucleotidyltransferase [Candidatus Aminicenantes bacterium]